MSTKVVADIIADFLASKDIKHVFGYQGSANAKILDAISQKGATGYVQNFHEQASAFCADAYSRASGNIGVAIVTSGPGATNLVTGIANAWCDSIPVLFITGQESSDFLTKNTQIRTNGFQDVDIVSIVKPITKYAKIIKDPNEILIELNKAYNIATSGRPGPVLLDIPLDIQFQQAKSEFVQVETVQDDDYEIRKISQFMNLLTKAKRPLVLAGGALKKDSINSLFNKFIEKTNIPVVTTINGIGTCESYGFSGLHGAVHANLAVKNADVLIVLGSRLGKQQTGKVQSDYTNAKIIHIDNDQNEINRFIKEDLSIFCDLTLFIEKIIKEIDNDFIVPSEWIDKLSEWKIKYQDKVCLSDKYLDPVKFVRYVSKVFPEKSLITTDVGQNQIWAAQGSDVKRFDHHLTSAGLGSMGYSLPAAIGAAYSSADKTVVAYCGDGGLQMNIQELQMLSMHKLNIKVVIFNNKTLGKIKDLQKQFYNSNFIGTDSRYFSSPDYKQLASAYNIDYIKIQDESEFNLVDNVFQTNRPYIIEVVVDEDASCLDKFSCQDIFDKENICD